MYIISLTIEHNFPPGSLLVSSMENSFSADVLAVLVQMFEAEAAVAK